MQGNELIKAIMDDIREEAMLAGEFHPHIPVLGMAYIESALHRHIRNQPSRDRETNE